MAKKIKQIKSLGEFGLIDYLTKDFTNYSKQVKLGIGDDAAVICKNNKEFEVVTMDTLVENDHFNCKWSTPYQVGMKAMEVNVSDIAAMGAVPSYVLISIVITNNAEIEWLSELYRGIKQVCDKYKISLIGGDTTRGDLKMISVTMVGITKKPCLRSGAKTGDLICVTGQVGGSSAGYLSLKKGDQLTSYIKKRHLEPKSRFDISSQIAKLASAMIDVSDGVGSEVKHIVSASKKGAIIYAKNLPVHADVFLAEEKLGLNKYYCALSGGEDFELLFTINQQDLGKLQKSRLIKKNEISVIGEIISNKKRLELILENNQTVKIPGGWDHTQK